MSKRSSSVTKTIDISSENNSEKYDDFNIKNNELEKKNLAKRKKAKRKTTKMKPILEPIIKKKVDPIIINDLIDRNKNMVKIKKKMKPISLTFIFRRNKYDISIGQKANFYDLKEKISRTINIPIDDFNIKLKNYNNKIEDSNLIKDLINNSKCPIFYVKKKIINSLIFSQIYFKNYKNKIIIDGIKDKDDLLNQIETFFNNSLINKDYLFEQIGLNKYSIAFTSRDIAFDFKRYLNILHLINVLYYDIKYFYKSENPIRSRNNNNTNNSMNINRFHFHYYSSPYVNISSPYITYEEIRRKEQLESKKKWICNKDFFSAVGNSNRLNTETFDKEYIYDYL